MYQEKLEKDIMIKTLTNQTLELNSRISQLEQVLCAKEDSDAKYDELCQQFTKLVENKDAYKSDLEICTNYLLEVEEKCQEAQKTSLELLQHLKERETENERLQSIIMELQKDATSKKLFVYHPVRDDPVDKKLSDFINAAPSRVRNNMNFVRESEGIYKYGKKRVFMKIEQDKIIIRVGGGYLTIEEFIDQYCL